MKKQLLTSKTIKPMLITILSLLAILCIVFVVFYLLPNITPGPRGNENADDNKTFHILVIGRSENESFLQQVYKGTQHLSETYHAAVELYVPGSLAEDVSMQSLFDYASFANADGVIAYIDSNDTTTEHPLVPPARIDGEIIPLITVGHYSPELTQVSFIGTNYSELGRTIAEETVASLNEKGTAFIINSSSQNNPNYSTLMNSLLSTLNGAEKISYNVLDQSSNESALLSDETFRKTLTSTEHPLLVCLTAEDTIRASQAVTELNKIKQIGIIGFGDNDTIELYFEKQLINELISVDPEKIGETAIHELFEYRNKGYANSYITADVQIRKSAK